MPLGIFSEKNSLVRLACVKHAASVRPEPGSNSPLIEEPFLARFIFGLKELRVALSSFSLARLCLTMNLFTSIVQFSRTTAPRGLRARVISDK